MKIKNLNSTPLSAIVQCLVVAFDGYFVKIPAEVSFWERRFNAARVNYELSFGAFEGDQLVAFIITGIDVEQGLKTAFNTGTGVIPEFRGLKLVDQIYATAIPHWKAAGVKKCQLEVIDQNHRAIRVYERIGFEQLRRLKCFSGTLTAKRAETIALKEIAPQELDSSKDPIYSWDHKCSAILISAKHYKAYKVYRATDYIGYFVIQPDKGYVAQLDVVEDQWDLLCSGIQQISAPVKLNNIDSSRITLIDYLLQNNIANSINQFEMEWVLPT